METAGNHKEADQSIAPNSPDANVEYVRAFASVQDMLHHAIIAHGNRAALKQIYSVCLTNGRIAYTRSKGSRLISENQHFKSQVRHALYTNPRFSRCPDDPDMWQVAPSLLNQAPKTCMVNPHDNVQTGAPAGGPSGTTPATPRRPPVASKRSRSRMTADPVSIPYDAKRARSRRMPGGAWGCLEPLRAPQGSLQGSLLPELDLAKVTPPLFTVPQVPSICSQSSNDLDCNSSQSCLSLLFEGAQLSRVISGQLSTDMDAPPQDLPKAPPLALLTPPRQGPPRAPWSPLGGPLGPSLLWGPAGSPMKLPSMNSGLSSAAAQPSTPHKNRRKSGRVQRAV